VPFSNDWNSIAVSLSGGADSALLSYLLCQLITEHNLKNFNFHIISHIRMWKTKPWQEHDSINVFNYLTKRFLNINFHRHVNFIAPELEWADRGPTIVDEYGKLVSGDNVEIRAFAEYVCYHNGVKAYYNAVTRNPKNVDFQGMTTRDIDPSEDNVHLEIMEHMGFVASHPFRFIEKSWIIEQYKKLDILDLFNITRSCEGEFDDLNYKTYVPGQFVPTCGNCFWCKEREWAIEQSK